jgi:hypothetical protein
MLRKRPKPSKAQTIVGMAVLAVLAGIAVGVYVRQFRINSAVIALRPPLLMQTESTAGTAAEALFPLPSDMAPLTAVEVFDPDTLSDKIDGKAEFYLPSGFTELKCQRISHSASPGSWVEIFAYHMGNGANAYAVFSSQKRDDARPVNLAPFAYAARNALFFVHGPHYVEVIASEDSEESIQAALTLARHFMKHHREEDASIPELALFPKEGRVEGSIRLLSSDVFGCACLDRVFTASYRMGKMETIAFLSRRESAEEAERLAVEFHDFLTAYGGMDAADAEFLPEAALVELFGTYELVFVRGPFLAGVHEAETRETAESLAKALDQRLSEFTHGN